MAVEPAYQHQAPEFAVGAQFDSFADLKHTCINAALHDVYEFDTVQVPSLLDT